MCGSLGSGTHGGKNNDGRKRLGTYSNKDWKIEVWKVKLA
jgi:hypothetical protein